MTIVTGLRCEHVANPLGVEASSPRLTWRMESERRGARQVAHRLEVASAPALLEEGRADLWDSGRVESDESVLVPYGGTRLRSRARCWWRVHVWDETGTECVSEPAWWEMGLLRASDWKAQWIAGDTPKKHHDVPACPLFRKAFRLKGRVASARAYVCGLGYHELYLNGRKVSDAVLHPAFTKYDEGVLYTVHDVTDYLVEGDNVAGIMVGNGWYNQHEHDVWNFHVAPWRCEPKALAQIEVSFSDAGSTAVLTDASWSCSTGAIEFDGLRTGEVYDAREEKDGWTEARYDASGWQQVRIGRPPGGAFRAQTMPPCRVTETIRPVSVSEVRPGVWVFDMGRNIAGWARLIVSGAAGTAVTMRYAEKLGPDGDIDQANINVFVTERDTFQTDTYVLKGVGVESYEPRFAYYGFQYVQVTGLSAAQASTDMLEGRVVHTDLERNGSFECSSELLNRIQEAAVASTLGNYHGMPTDCPHREKCGWTGDAQLSAEQVLYNLEPAAAYTKWMDDLADCQRPSGALPGIVPTGGWGYNWGAGPAWDSAYILIPWYLYLYRGDTAVLSRHYEGMKRYLGFLAALATDHIVQFGLGDWCPPSSGSESHRAPAELTNTAYYYVDACVLARVASLLGKGADARRFDKLAIRIKKAARKHFYDKKTGRVAGHGQTSIACFLYQGLIEPEEAETFGAMLVDEVTACNDHIDCGILGAKYTLNALTDLGRADVAYRIVTQRDYPGWGLWIEQGATTLWETWDGLASRNHHMFSDVSAWFYKALAGIRLDADRPAFKHAVIKPWPVGELTWAAGETRTPYGLLRSAWKREDGRFTLDVAVPPNSSATVHLPTGDAAGVLEGGRPVREAEGVEPVGTGGGRVVCKVGAGRYRFEFSAAG